MQCYRPCYFVSLPLSHVRMLWKVAVLFTATCCRRRDDGCGVVMVEEGRRAHISNIHQANITVTILCVAASLIFWRGVVVVRDTTGARLTGAGVTGGRGTSTSATRRSGRPPLPRRWQRCLPEYKSTGPSRRRSASRPTCRSC